jgi:hypothetical protein
VPALHGAQDKVLPWPDCENPELQVQVEDACGENEFIGQLLHSSSPAYE